MSDSEFKKIEQDVSEREGSYKGLLKEALLTSKEDYEAIFSSLPEIRKWIEPGSGHGLGPVMFAKCYPDKSAIGIEFERSRYEASEALKRREAISNVQFFHEDLLNFDLPRGDAYFLYFPTGMVLDKILFEIGTMDSGVRVIAIESHGDLLPRLEKEKWLQKVKEIPLSTLRHYPYAVVYNKVGPYQYSLHGQSFLKKYLLIKDDNGEKWLGESFGLEWSRNNEFNLQLPPRTINSEQIIGIFTLEEVEKIYHFALYLRRLGELRIETENAQHSGQIRKIFISPCFKVEISTGHQLEWKQIKKILWENALCYESSSGYYYFPRAV